MSDFAALLINLLMASTLEQTLSLVVEALLQFYHAKNLCVLLWDHELGRYTVGQTWLRSDCTKPPADVRRHALAFAQKARLHEMEHLMTFESGIYAQPLTLNQRPVAAIIWEGNNDVEGLQSNENYLKLLQVITKALSDSTRLEFAQQEHAQAVADRERLEQLLVAVEHQQRTIDHLLASERQFSASLEAIVEERTSELRAAQTRLIQSEKLAVIGQLAGSLAHEINNPLQAIQSGLGLAVADVKSKQYRHIEQDLLVIQQELERIETIFRQMLDFYRPISQERITFDLNTVCESVCALMKKRLQKAKIVLDLQLTPALPPTCGDPNQIKQVLLNLLLNAADAMYSGEGCVTLKTTYDATRVYLAVSDTGTGILPEHQAHIFEPLFTTKPRGLGLGLAISREIIERHHGRIELSSVPNVGTTFTISLPIEGACHEAK